MGHTLIQWRRRVRADINNKQILIRRKKYIKIACLYLRSCCFSCRNKNNLFVGSGQGLGVRLIRDSFSGITTHMALVHVLTTPLMNMLDD